MIPDLIEGQREQLDKLPIFGADDKVRVHRSNIVMLQNIEETLQSTLRKVDALLADKQKNTDEEPPEDSA